MSRQPFRKCVSSWQERWSGEGYAFAEERQTTLRAWGVNTIDPRIRSLKEDGRSTSGHVTADEVALFGLTHGRWSYVIFIGAGGVFEEGLVEVIFGAFWLSEVVDGDGEDVFAKLHF